MRAVGIRISKEVGERYSREGVVVGEGGLVEFDHYGCCRCICNWGCRKGRKVVMRPGRRFGVGRCEESRADLEWICSSAMHPC